MNEFQDILKGLQDGKRYRELRLPCGVDLTSNDYLGMAQEPFLKQAAIEFLNGGADIGAAGSRLLRGHTQAHESLESFAARYFLSESALYFSTGFQANYAILSTLPGRGDIILYDSLVHASMRDGIRASLAKAYKFTHNDVNALENLLKKFHKQAQKIWIAVESVYSMDGDCAPLTEIYYLARRYNAYVIVDEAHASGIYGRHGRGLMYDAAEKNGYERIITLHTCGKAIGVAGGLVCASRSVVEYLVNFSRPFIYSTAPMPLQAYLVQKSLEFLDSEEGQKRREKLFSLCAVGKDLFGGYGTQIIPIILGEDEKAVRVAAALQDQGYDIRAIRPPSVPEGTARLRLSLSSLTDKDVLQSLANDLKSNLLSGENA
jgi:8-amino-7-oxononanoate synthase